MKRLFILFLLLSGFVFAQDQKDFQKLPSRYGYEITRAPVVGFNYFINYEGPDWFPSLYIAVSVQNDFLQFTQKDNSFYSKYQITATVRKEKQTILARTWENSTQLKDFDLTNSKRDFQNSTYKIDISETEYALMDSGTYDVILQVHDMLSSRDYKNKRKLKYKPGEKEDKNQHTEITFLNSDQITDGAITDISALRDAVDFAKPVIAYMAVKGFASDSININARVFKKTKSEKALLKQEFIAPIAKSAGSFKIKYVLPSDLMEEGEYLLRFSLENDTGTLEVEKEFSVLWLTKPLYLYKADLAIRPMKYLLNKVQIEEVKELSIEELEVWLKKFWQERDPSQGTVYNELMTEYFNRVTESVRDYSTRFKEGWQTDRGMVFLLYGEPMEIENRKYTANSIPHIIWKYQDAVFTFADFNKTGEFTLVENLADRN